MILLNALVLASALQLLPTAHAADGCGSDGKSSACDFTASSSAATSALSATATYGDAASGGPAGSVPAEASAPPGRPRFARGGSELELTRDLSDRRSSVSLQVLGEVLRDRLFDRSTPGWSDDDVSILIESLIFNPSLLNDDETPPGAILTRTLSPVFERVDLGDVIENRTVRASFEKTFLMLRLVDLHRRIGPEVQSRALQTLVASALVQSLGESMNHRAFVKSYPSEAQLLTALERIQAATGTGSWIEDEIGSRRTAEKLYALQSRALEYRIDDREARATAFSAIAGLLLATGVAFSGLDWIHAQHLDGPFLASWIASPFVAGGGALGISRWRRPRRLARARARVDAFARHCQLRLAGRGR